MKIDESQLLNEIDYPLLADLRSLENGYQRFLSRKLPFKLDESAAIADPQQTVVTPSENPLFALTGSVNLVA